MKHPKQTRPGAESAQPIGSFDLAGLLERCVGSAAIAAKVLDKFELQAAADVREITSALRASEAHRIARTAHALKGAAGALSAAGLTEAASRMEAAARQGDLLAAERCLAALEYEIRRCLAELPAARRELGATKPSPTESGGATCES